MTLDEKQQEELIPKLQVLDDMYSDKSLVSLAARDYYYEHYADESERKRMDIEDIVATIIGTIVVAGVLLLGVVAIIMWSLGGWK